MAAALPPLNQQLSGGDTPGAQPLIIGQVQFNSIEVPTKLPIGATEQRLVVIETIGGGRIVQPLGVQPTAVEWEGTFYGANVFARVQELRSYVVSGQEYPLTWFSESWTCTVKSFTPSFKNIWICDYKISLEITTGAALTSTTFPTVDSQVDAINSQVQTIVDNLALNADAVGFGPVSILWQDYLIALGILYESEQVGF